MYLTLEVVGHPEGPVVSKPPRPVGPGGLTIGRSSGNDWVIPYVYISRRHAHITYADGRFFIESLGTNPVAIGQAKNFLTTGRPQPLEHGDHLFIEDYEIVVAIFEGDVPSEPKSISDDPFADSLPEPVAERPIPAGWLDGVREPVQRPGRANPRDVLDDAFIPLPSPRQSSEWWDRASSTPRGRSGSVPAPQAAAAARPEGPTPSDTESPQTQFPGQSPATGRDLTRGSSDFGEWRDPPGTLHGYLPVARDASGQPTGSYYRVWFGTNRRPVNPFHPNEGFDASPDKALHVGSCVVRVPHAHRPGSIGSSALQRIFILRADDRLAVESIQVVDADRLLEELEAGLSVDPNKRALLYIHGYNTTFQGAAVRAAQIGFDLGIRGIMAFFSWPSHGTIRHYLADGTAIELAEDSFVQYVQLLMRVEGIQHIDILAHSMGNRLLLRTIAILSQLKATAERPVRIRHILLAAPDVDIGKFGQVVEHYRSVLDRWTTVYTCRKDLAIAASTWLSDAKRLGYEPPVYSDFGLDTISASLLPLDWLGHGYFAAAQPLLADMTAILDHDSRPESRKLLAVGGHPPTYWRLR